MEVSIEICDLDWKVILCNSDDPKLTCNEDNVCGRCYKVQKLILINDSLSDDLLLRTLTHEITHAFIWSYGFEDVNFEEEVVCNFIETYATEITEMAGKLFSIFKRPEEKSKKKSKA